MLFGTHHRVVLLNFSGCLIPTRGCPPYAVRDSPPRRVSPSTTSSPSFSHVGTDPLPSSHYASGLLPRSANPLAATAASSCLCSQGRHITTPASSSSIVFSSNNNNCDIRLCGYGLAPILVVLPANHSLGSVSYASLALFSFLGSMERGHWSFS